MEGREVRVWVHSNAERVELLLNGTSMGVQEVKPNTHLEWNVPYAPGRLEARGYRGGKVALTDVRETTGPAAHIVLVPDRATIDADGEDVSSVAVQIVDAQGRVVPTADHEVTFEVTGSGALLGLGNGDPSDHADDKGVVRRAFNGYCMAIVQASKTAGSLTVKATAETLGGATAIITCRPATPRPSA
jgi:beta-galactosidase